MDIDKKIKKAINLGKDTKKASLFIPKGMYTDKSSKEYKALDAAGRIKKDITGGTKSGATGTQKYSKSELAAVKFLIKNGQKPTASKIATIGALIKTDRSRTSTRAQIIKANKTKSMGKKK
jgi:hypothetical protein